ncbi:small conductance mechanosensitive channel [Marininema mesophilum]|uniref:Small conductance mechanosensitive channel n=1 Tax=Marininema mesophilum TaxID=1048340 RepID=A0A1H2WFG8_9BACL|nr:mechanosensitive ion channel family protein [Marininema mesophilum]SDW79216.1 small conductance mechanosensitive channel [Marininema mesophilum]
MQWMLVAAGLNNDVKDVQKKAEEIAQNPAKKFWDPLFNDILIPLFQIAIIIGITYIALRYVGHVVDRLLNISRFKQKRGATLARLLKSTARYAIYFISAITILKQVNIDVTPILAGAGVIGLAVGFGAQNLVRDIITGFFIIFDQQMEIGDFVQINDNIQGTVEEIGLRVTKVREFNERVHYFSNGEITRVTNYNRDRMRPLMAVTVPYEEDQQYVQSILDEICEDLSRRFSPYIIEPFSVFGITNIQSDGVEYTLTAVSTPEEYWMIEREMRKTIVTKFIEKSIEIAYPRQVLTASNDLHAMMSKRQEKERFREVAATTGDHIPPRKDRGGPRKDEDGDGDGEAT